ncbi:unnamed protein product [Peronospora destructor]|uniref:GDP-D-glucose phosphorylase 1 n=1 Tax=Peronospora destructor TaxID=86335 RepID=A0AAV0UE69_9STRA|nr:unnamed protein product [Peronospora destructor]
MTSTNLGEWLLSQWDLAASAGVMRTKVDDTMRRRVPGTLGFVVQFNPSHLKNKRPVDPLLLKLSTDETSAKPKLSGFDFTMAKREEFLSGFRFKTEDDQHLTSVQTIDMGDVSKDEPEHFVLVNVAPLVRGHMLFVPEINLVKPQKMTKKFMLYALSISQAIQREDFALGFNSAGAWSSVNHFHLQGYFFPHFENETIVNFPVATQLREELFRIGGVVVKYLLDWKTTSYVIEPEDPASNEAHVMEIAWTILELLQAQEIPHNLLVVGRVVFIFPRQPQRENGAGLWTDSASETDTTTASAGRLRIAVAELSGLIIAGDSAVYDNLTEVMFNTILKKEVSLVASEEAALTAALKEKLNVKTK